MSCMVIGTTGWSEIKEEAGVQREKELEPFWQDMIVNGCTVERFRDSRNSAWDIIDMANRQQNVALSTEIVKEKKRMNETAAGFLLSAELRRKIADHEKTIRTLQEQAQIQESLMLASELQQKKAELEREIAGIMTQIQTMKIPFDRKVAAFFRKSRKDGIV